MKPEHNIEKAIGSFDSIKPAEAPIGFTEKVLAKLSNAPKIVPMRVVWAAAAAIAMLVALNVWVDFGKTNTTRQADNGASQAASEFGLTTTGFWY